MQLLPGDSDQFAGVSFAWYDSPVGDSSIDAVDRSFQEFGGLFGVAAPSLGYRISGNSGRRLVLVAIR